MPIQIPSLSDITDFLTIIIIPLAAWATALWAGLVIWTFKDMRARSRDPFAQIAASLMVAILTVPGWMIYLMLRPRETLAQAYERALEEEALLQEIEERIACPQCSLSTKEEWLYCPSCSYELSIPCSSCNKALRHSWKSCPYCGADASSSRPTPIQKDKPTFTAPSAAPVRQDIVPDRSLSENS